MNGSPPPPAYSAVEAEKDRGMRFEAEGGMRYSTWSLGSYYGYYWD